MVGYVLILLGFVGLGLFVAVVAGSDVNRTGVAVCRACGLLKRASPRVRVGLRRQHCPSGSVALTRIGGLDVVDTFGTAVSPDFRSS